MIITAADLDVPCSQAVLDQLNNMPDDAWDHLYNPFEDKYILHRDSYTTEMRYMLQDLKAKVILLWKLDSATGYYIDHTDHWTAMLAYKARIAGGSGYLLPHLDANTNPITKRHKIATALLYLGDKQQLIIGGALRLYTEGELFTSVPANPGTLVIFTGDPVR